MRISWVALLALAACATPPPPHVSQPTSCLIRNDNLELVQCFEFIGQFSRDNAQKTCSEMEGHPELAANASCTEEALVGSCATNPGTDIEVMERCYRDSDVCLERCKRHAGRFYPAPTH